MATLQDRLNNAMQGGAKATAPASTNTQNLQQRLNNAMQSSAPPAPKVADTGKEDDRNIFEKLADFVGYTGQKAVSGALEGTEGVVNTGSYYQQLAQKSAMQQAAGGAAMAAAFSKNPYVDALAEKRQAEAQESAVTPMKTVANFGDRYAQKVEEKYADKPLSGATRIIGGAAEGLGGLLPSTVANLIVPGSGLAVMTTGAIGNAVQEQKKAGVDDNRAIAYGITVGAIEALTEKMLGGMGGLFGKGALDDVAKNLIKSNVNNGAVAAGMNTLASFFGEGLEEFVAEYAQALANRGIVGTDDRNFGEVSKDALRSALIGGIVGSIANIGDSLRTGKSVTPKQAAIEAAENTAKTVENAMPAQGEISRSDGVSSQPTTDTSKDTGAVRGMPGLATDGLLGKVRATASEISSYIERALSRSKYVPDSIVSDESVEDLELADVSPSLANKIFSEYGVDISGGKHILRDNNLRHIFNSHGPYTNEADPVIAADLKMIPTIINDASEVYYVPRKDGKRGLIYEYHYGDNSTYYLEQIIDGNSLVNAQMIKTPAGTTPKLPGLAEAKQNKTSTFAAPGAVAGNAASPQMYVQDVWRGASDSTITQNPAESNTPNAQEKRGTGAAPLNFIVNEGEQVDTQSRSTVENKNLTPEQRAQVTPDTHERISEAESLHRAQTGLYTDSEGNIVGYQESIDELLDLYRAMSGVESDRLQLLLAEAGRRNDIENIKRISRKWQEDKSFVAQALQATQKWIGDSPTTNIARIIAIVDKYAQTHKAKKGRTIEVPDFLIEAYLNAETDSVRDAVIDDIQSYVAQQTRTTLLDAWTALRYTNMLGNFKTQGRNISGNVVNSLLYSVKNDVAALMELALPADQRTKSAFVGREWMKAAKSDYANAKRTISRYGKYKGDSNESDFISGIDDRRNILGTYNPLEYYRQATNYAMNKGDEIFSKAAYSRALAGYLKAKGITPESLAAGTVDAGIMEAARDYAVKQAQEVTFRDSNAFSDWVSRIGRRADTPKAVKAVTEGIAPFRRTPANVMVRAVEFSPLGFLNTAIQTAKVKKSGENVSASDIIDALSKNVTGSALFALGMILADNGLLRATGDDEDEDVDALMNRQDYSIVIPGEGSYTMDWLTPASLIMFTGAELMEMISDEGFTFADVESAITSLADPLINMSMLSGVNDTLENIKYSDNNLIQMAATSALSYLTQGLTNTLAGQIERIAEPERMSTYVDSENAIPDWLERSIGKASAKTPGKDYNQSAYLDEFGNTESNGSVGERVFENLFSPGYFSEGNEGRAAYDFVQETYDALNYNAAPDAYAPKSIQNGDEVVKLSQQERDKYQKVRGQAAEDYLTAASTNQKYKSLSNDEKVEVLKDLKSQAAKEAKIDVLGDIGKTVKQSATEKAIAALGAGDMVTYYAYWNAMDVPAHYTSNPNWQKFQTILDMGFDDGASLALMEAVNEDTGKKLRAAYNEGVPLADIVAYYEANTSRKSDGTEKKAADKKRAIRETEFSSTRNRAILNRIF